LQAPANLDDHHFRDVLKRFAPRWPELVARHPSAPLGPSATAGRPVGRVTGALTPAPSLSLLRKALPRRGGPGCGGPAIARSPAPRPSSQGALRHPSRSGVRGHRHRSGSRQSPGGGGRGRPPPGAWR
jgi:hypothetical protein